MFSINLLIIVFRAEWFVFFQPKAADVTMDFIYDPNLLTPICCRLNQMSHLGFEMVGILCETRNRDKNWVHPCNG